MQLAAWELWASVSPLPFVLFPQNYCCLRVGCWAICVMFVKTFCELQRAIELYGLVILILLLYGWKNNRLLINKSVNGDC